jgi:acetyl-CoA carboxylase biotin carboxyl carrier protein
MGENEVAGSGGEMKISPPLGAFNLEHLNEIIRLCRENDIAELKIKQRGQSIYIKRQGATPPVEYVVAGPAPAQVAVPLPVSPPSAAAPEAVPAAGEVSPEEEKSVTVRSPMVGTFYRAPAPDAPPFVEIGDAVKENTVLCIIEAMKLMNEIKAETRGTVVKILVENAQPVEYNQPMFLIKPE